MTAVAGSDGRQPRVSLLMPNRDNATVLDLVLDKLALNTQYPDVELIVVDDGSTDGSREILRRWQDSQRFAEFRVIDHEHSDGGVVDALNVGLRAATGELVVQLDADASIETTAWLRKMVSFFLTDTRIGVVTSKVVTDDGELQSCGIEVIGPKGYYNRGSEPTEAAGKRTSYRPVRTFREDQWPGSEQIAEVDGGMGVCMMYRREAALEVGGYDRGFAPVWLDDLDLTISLRRSGLKVFYLPEVRAVHHLGKRARPDDRPAELGLARRAARGMRQGMGSVLPPEVRLRLVRVLGLHRPPRWYRQRLAHHYGYWQKKWGFDMLNPDLDVVRKRWGQTELCWRMNPEMQRAGELIIAQFEANARDL